MIYFIRDALTDHVKIGTAADPWVRLGQIQVSSPGELSIIGIEDGGYDREAELHVRFEADRRRGEWFAFSPAIKAHVATLPAVDRPGRARTNWGDSGLRDADLVVSLGVSHAQLSRIRRGLGVPSLSLATRIVALTGVSYEWLARGA